MRQANIHTGSVIRIMKSILVSYVITGVLLLLIAGLMYRFRMDEGKIQIGMIVTYLLSCFIGGFLSGKMMKSRQFLWGSVTGLFYFLIMMLVSLAVNRELQANSSGFITSFLLCIGGGTLGGMLS